MRITAIVPSLIALSTVLFSCSSDPEEAAAASCRIETVPDDPSFREHVLPTMQGSCTFSSSCHGDRTRSQVDLYLGKKKPKTAADEMTPAEVTAMLAGIVNMPSGTAPAVNIITAGDASASFLMHKIDDTHRDQGFQCEEQESDLDHPCGDSMPQTAAELLCANERDTIRNWINQGAKDN